MTPGSVGWVMLDGSGPDTETLDHDVFDFAGGSADDGDFAKHLAAVRGVLAIAAASGHELRSIGVTWTDDAAATAKLVLNSLPGLGFDKVVPVRIGQTDTSNEAQLMLARDAALRGEFERRDRPRAVDPPAAVQATCPHGRPHRRRDSAVRRGSGTRWSAGAPAGVRLVGNLAQCPGRFGTRDTTACRGHNPAGGGAPRTGTASTWGRPRHRRTGAAGSRRDAVDRERTDA